jgi:nicotinate-nucleotide--dimethylbenzimidazole phosphoribosyltransferase
MKLSDVIKEIRPLSTDFLAQAREHTANLALPPRALGRLHDVSERLCAISESLKPKVDKKAFVVMAGDHGVAKEGVSAFPQEVTGQMVANFVRGGAGINVLARQLGAGVCVVDMGIVPEIQPPVLADNNRFLVRKVACGTSNMVHGPAMSLEQAEQAIMTGFDIACELFDEGVELLGTGDMGIANTTPSTAIAAVLTGRRVDDLIGRGTGVCGEGLERKRQAICKALDINKPAPGDGLDVLAKVGGFEIGGICGCILAAAYKRRPVLVDGFISTASALLAQALCPLSTAFMFSSHSSAESGHLYMLTQLELDPLLDLGLRLGEGTGSALAMHVLEAACRVFNEVLTFEQAGVSTSK